LKEKRKKKSGLQWDTYWKWMGPLCKS